MVVGFSKDLFQPETGKGEEMPVFRPGTTCWREIWCRLRNHKGALVGLIIIVLILIMALLGPLLTPYAPDSQHLAEGFTNRPPDAQHWFGTDALGRDIFTRLCYGARVSLLIGFASAAIQFLVGFVYGGLAGYLGGWVDEVMMRFVEILSGVPFLLYIILLMVVMGPGLHTVMIALGAVYWLPAARLVRGQVLSLKEQDYVVCARIMGASPWRIIFRHILPNSIGPVIVYVSLTVSDAIFTEACLSFLGLGVSAPFPSWGSLASSGMAVIRLYPWQLLFPAFFISVTILSFNMLSDGLQEALGPRGRR